MERPESLADNYGIPVLVNSATHEKYESQPGFEHDGFYVPAGTYNIEISGKCYGAPDDAPKQSYTRKETVTVVEGAEKQVVKLPFENLPFCGQIRGHLDIPEGGEREYAVEVAAFDHPVVAPGVGLKGQIEVDNEGNFVQYNLKPGTYHFTIQPRFGKGEFGLPAHSTTGDLANLAPPILGFPGTPVGLHMSPYCEELITDDQGVSAVVVEQGKSSSVPNWTVKNTCATDTDAKIRIEGTPVVGETIKAVLSDIDLINATVNYQWYGKLYESEWNDWSTGANIYGWPEKYGYLPSSDSIPLYAPIQGKQVRVVAYVNRPGKNTLALISEPVVVGEKKAEGNQPGTTTPTPSTPKPEENTPAPVAELKADKSSVVPTAKVTLKGEGFLAGEDIRLEFHSDPVVLGTVKADAKGAFSAELTVPANAAPGQHHFVAVGLKSGKVIKTPVAVDMPGAKPSANPKGALAKTGSSAEALLLASIGLGLAGVAAYRRRTAR